MTTKSSTSPRPVIDLSEIATPALLIDLPTVERNVRKMAEYVRSHGLDLRPHIKTHKSLSMAQLQAQAGAKGLTVAKVGEAEVMSEVSDDLLVAYPLVDRARVQRIASLATEQTVRVAVDSTTACDIIAQATSHYGSTAGILVDVDVGFHRTGVQDAESALRMAEHVERADGLRLDGIMCFPGHLNSPPDQQGQELSQIDRKLREVRDLWREHGLKARIVSGGSTPTARQSHLVSALTEIRPGTYVYNDWNTVVGGQCGVGDCAASVLSTVVSDAVPGKVVVDAGSKTLTSDRNVHLGEAGGYGHVVGYPDARVVRLSEEHGEIDVEGCEVRPVVGERLRIIPNHICPAVNLQDHFWIGRGEDSYERARVDARGLLS
jgi:D-serine deaminase-like pyridoxal phosphate-dependent protein